MVLKAKLCLAFAIIGLLGFCQIASGQSTTTAAETPSTITSATEAPTTVPTATIATETTIAPPVEAQNNATTKPPPESTTEPPPESTTEPPPESTTEPPPESTTEEPTTESTTEEPTTETPTTLPPPVEPAKAFPNNIGRFRSTDENNRCIILDGAFKILVKVEKLDNTTKNETLLVPELANVIEACPKEQELTISWTAESKSQNKTEFSNKITLTFEKSSAEGESAAAKESFQLTQVVVSFAPEQFDGYSGKLDKITTYTATDLSNFVTPLNSSYSCNHTESIIGNANGTGFQFEMKVANVRLEAYKIYKMPSKGDEFSPKISCKADDKRPSKKGLIIGLSVTLVLLAVGGAIGYYFWRRRQHAGYQRMDS